MVDDAARPSLARRQRAVDLLERVGPQLAAQASERLEPRDAAALQARVARRFVDAYEPLEHLYGSAHQLGELVAGLLERVVEASARRSEDLRRLDHRREIDPDWYLHERNIGYVCYTDRFAGRLEAVADRLDYLAELGVTYLHLMPLLQPREGANDGGYAVADYRAVDPRLGDMADLEALAAALRARDMSLCVDLVVNHTAREHPWARKALAGDPTYRAFYYLFADRSEPDRYEASLPQVFPDTAPGSFTWVDELDAWVWTTFHDYQWDLNYTNPAVFAEMLDVMLYLANRGVEVLRLDAVPFLWKRVGTDCQNQPEVHELLQAWRALVGMAAPAVVFKAEAIVEPGQLVRYLGTHDDRHRPECELAYHNQLMVMGWSALAQRNARLAAQALGRMRTPPPTTSWVTYVRCHDDIGWAVTEHDAAAVGLDGRAHRRFLVDFYAGRHPLSFARGEPFQEEPATGDARTSGSAASLCGIEAALEAGDPELLDQAVRRLLLLYGLAYAYGGIPLVYMGDELALRNDHAYRADPGTGADNRWMHRPRMDWAAAERRHDPAALEGRVFAGLARLGQVRACMPQLRAGGVTKPLWVDHDAVLAFLRDHPRTGQALVLANFADTGASVDARVLDALRHRGWDTLCDALAPHGALDVRAGRIHLPRLGLALVVRD